MPCNSLLLLSGTEQALNQAKAEVQDLKTKFANQKAELDSLRVERDALQTTLREAGQSRAISSPTGKQELHFLELLVQKDSQRAESIRTWSYRCSQLEESLQQLAAKYEKLDKLHEDEISSLQSRLEVEQSKANSLHEALAQLHQITPNLNNFEDVKESDVKEEEKCSPFKVMDDLEQEWLNIEKITDPQFINSDATNGGKETLGQASLSTVRINHDPRGLTPALYSPAQSFRLSPAETPFQSTITEQGNMQSSGLPSVAKVISFNYRPLLPDCESGDR